MATPRSHAIHAEDAPETPLPTAGTIIKDPPTIHDVMGQMAAYLLAQYADSATDQVLVDDAARLLADGNLIPAWRHLARMVEQVLNVPPGVA